MDSTLLPQSQNTIKGPPATRWEYNPYRAKLTRDGKFFALVTPDGRNALSGSDAATLLQALNSTQEAQERIDSPQDSGIKEERKV